MDYKYKDSAHQKHDYNRYIHYENVESTEGIQIHTASIVSAFLKQNNIYDIDSFHELIDGIACLGVDWFIN